MKAARTLVLLRVVWLMFAADNIAYYATGVYAIDDRNAGINILQVRRIAYSS